MPKQVPMYLDERLSEGFVIVCTGGGGEHSFVMRWARPVDRMPAVWPERRCRLS